MSTGRMRVEEGEGFAEGRRKPTSIPNNYLEAQYIVIPLPRYVLDVALEQCGQSTELAVPGKAEGVAWVEVVDSSGWGAS